MPQPKCETCKQYKPWERVRDQGECRRRAPVAGPGGGFPFVVAQDWCGEHEPRKEEPGDAPDGTDV